MKPLLKYRWALPAVLAGMGIGLAATQLAVHAPLVVAVHRGIEGEAFKKAIERYSKNGHAVHVVELPYEELRKAVRESVYGGDRRWRFDVVMIDDPWLPDLDAGLDPFGADAVDGDFVDPCRKVAQSEEHPGLFAAVPYVGNSQLLCYRDKPPESWEKLLAESSASSKLTDNFAYVMRVRAGNSILTDFLPILWAADPQSLAPVPPPEVRENARPAFKQFERLGKSRRFATASQDDFDLAAYVLRDKASMSIIWSAWAMQLRNTSADLKNFKFGQVPGKPVLGAWLLGVPLISKHKPDAEEFVRYVTSKEELECAALDGNPPPRKSVFEKKDLSEKNALSEKKDLCEKKDLYEKYPSFPAQLESLTKAVPRPRIKDWDVLEKQIGEYLAALNAGLINVDNAFRGSMEAAASVGKEDLPLMNADKRR